MSLYVGMRILSRTFPVSMVLVGDDGFEAWNTCLIRQKCRYAQCKNNDFTFVIKDLSHGFFENCSFWSIFAKKIEYLCALRIETRLQDGLPPKDATGSS